jgi:hypothetical protein
MMMLDICSMRVTDVQVDASKKMLVKSKLFYVNVSPRIGTRSEASPCLAFGLPRPLVRKAEFQHGSINVEEF